MLKFSVRHIFVSVVLLFFLLSCGTQRPQGGLLYDPKEVAQLSNKLGVGLSNMDKDDDRNMPLYAEASLWLGVPYRSGGLSRKGLDCSGFTFLMYQKVYGKTIPRSTADLSKMKMSNISKQNLKTGDLVFFATSEDKNRINHVGIYLKEGHFIHASTSKGVIVSKLDESYYERAWKKGGRLK
ncbi:MAG: C40 family peptidase [Prevotella sp.]|jgi:lipoprotein Spr|nr:C40 family peptidase [Prevotella sp.]